LQPLFYCGGFCVSEPAVKPPAKYEPRSGKKANFLKNIFDFLALVISFWYIGFVWEFLF